MAEQHVSECQWFVRTPLASSKAPLDSRVTDTRTCSLRARQVICVVCGWTRRLSVSQSLSLSLSLLLVVASLRVAESCVCSCGMTESLSCVRVYTCVHVCVRFFIRLQLEVRVPQRDATSGERRKVDALVSRSEDGTVGEGWLGRDTTILHCTHRCIPHPHSTSASFHLFSSAMVSLCLLWIFWQIQTTMKLATRRDTEICVSIQLTEISMYLDYTLLASFRRVLESLSPLAATDDNPPRASPQKGVAPWTSQRSGALGAKPVISWTGARGTLGSFLLEIESLRAVSDSVLTHIDLKGDNIIFARVGLVKISLQPMGTRMPSTHLDAEESSSLRK